MSSLFLMATLLSGVAGFAPCGRAGAACRPAPAMSPPRPSADPLQMRLPLVGGALSAVTAACTPRSLPVKAATAVFLVALAAISALWVIGGPDETTDETPAADPPTDPPPPLTSAAATLGVKSGETPLFGTKSGEATAADSSAGASPSIPPAAVPWVREADQLHEQKRFSE